MATTDSENPYDAIKTYVRRISVYNEAIPLLDPTTRPLAAAVGQAVKQIEAALDSISGPSKTSYENQPYVILNGVEVGRASEVVIDQDHLHGTSTLTVDLPGLESRPELEVDQFDALNDLRDLAYENAKSKGFHESTPEVTAEGWLANDAMKMALIHSEVSEALEALREGFAPTALYYIEDDGWVVDEERDECGNLNKPEGVPAELADVIIRVLDYCGSREIDIAEAVRRKVAYNATRPALHGKEF